MLSDEMLHFYTGLENYSKFMVVLECLGLAAYHLNYYYGPEPSISVEDQILLTLMKLRRHSPHQELRFLFALNDKQVSTWINFMSCQWEEIEWWPVKELIQYYTPSDFKKKFQISELL